MYSLVRSHTASAKPPKRNLPCQARFPLGAVRRSDHIRSVECSCIGRPLRPNARPCQSRFPNSRLRTPSFRLYPLRFRFHRFYHFYMNYGAAADIAQESPISASSRLRTIDSVSGAASQAPTAKVPSLPALLGGGGGISNFVLSAIIRWKPIPTPSITARRIAHPMAPFRIARGPPLTASEPPVKNPAMMAFHGSSFLRTPLTAQSKVENSPPQTPKFPPNTGARAFIAVIAVEAQVSAL